MLTIHAADSVRLTWDGAPLVEGAVAVSGDRVAAIGPLAEVREAYPEARVRQWAGVLGPGLAHHGPLPEAPSPRERVHAVLKSGATAVTGAGLDSELRAAAVRGGVLLLAGPRTAVLAVDGRADLAVFSAVSGAGTGAVSGAASSAGTGVPSGAASSEGSYGGPVGGPDGGSVGGPDGGPAGGECLATVCAGRLVHRRR
ncbi:imidazolonepropionase-like domain-containing protein [Streptomyces tsukubensis]|uniref:imidazolonepropionase-like domain-containing protein n=1 Tax=Streptomyces tsukubensis TaxID=83656 RepID=UPI002693C5D3|nr:hypothetical protein [Streptomyces tsukubensis]